jgi:YcaO-like protein with predicted kinase domain
VTRRAMSPEETWARIQPMLGELGITRVATLTGLDTLGEPVVSAVRPLSRTLAVSQGKGRTLTAARVSAVMEAAESFYAERCRAHLVSGSAAALEGLGLRLVTIAALPLVPGARPLQPDEPCVWIEGHDLMHGAPCWVPFAMVHTNYTPGGQIGAPRFAETTRGLAAGNTPMECVSHALAELLEGDANAGIGRLGDEAFGERVIDPDTVNDPDCRRLLEACERQGLAVVLIDATGPTGVASVACVLLAREDDSWQIIPAARGSGCHPAREVACYRALSEAAQSRVTLISGAREDLTRRLYQRSQDPARRQQLRQLAKRGGRSFDALPSCQGPHAGADVAYMLERLLAVGCDEAVAVDLTQDPRIPVGRVIVPGLRPEPAQ